MSKNPVTLGRKWAKEIWEAQCTNDRDCPFEDNEIIPREMSKDQWVAFATPVWANGWLAGKQADAAKECEMSNCDCPKQDGYANCCKLKRLTDAAMRDIAGGGPQTGPIYHREIRQALNLPAEGDGRDIVPNTHCSDCRKNQCRHHGKAST